jgi:hypothetical protein
VPQPIDTEPVDTEPVDTEPVDTEPVDTEPVAVELVAEPDDAAPDLENVPSVEQPTEGLLVDTLDESAFAPETEPASDAIAIENAEPALRAPLRPGPGLIPRRVERPRAEEVAAPFWDEAWEEPPIEEEPYDDLPSDADALLTLEHLPAEVPAAEVTEEITEEAAHAPDVEAVELVTEEDHPIFADEALSAPAPALPGGLEEPEVEESAFPVPVEEWAVVATTDQALRPQMVVDLDHLHVDQASLEPDLELLFAGAPAPEGEKSGLLGAVRSAFARNKTSHEHEFVEAPGGIGIVRQICAECGYISIGVAD